MNNNFIKKSIDILDKCVDFEHIEDRNYIRRKLNIITAYKDKIPSHEYEKIQAVIDNLINPIVYNTNYFDFLKKDEFGETDEKGHFVIKSEEAFDKMIYLLCEHSINLSNKIHERLDSYC